MNAPIIRHVTSQPNVCERAIKTILLACKRSSCSAISCRARPRLNCKPPRRGAFWLHSTAVFAGAGLSTRSTDFAVRCNYIRNGWRYRPPQVQRDGGGGGDRHFSNYYYVPAFGPRDTCARCARNTCDLLPAVYLLLRRPTMANIHTRVFRTPVIRSVVAVEANKISANKIYSRIINTGWLGQKFRSRLRNIMINSPNLSEKIRLILRDVFCRFLIFRNFLTSRGFFSAKNTAWLEMRGFKQDFLLVYETRIHKHAT